MNRPYIDPYALLGVEPAASSADIKKAYFALVREHPPARAPEMFKRIRSAYERLRDPDTRADVEMLRLRTWVAPGRSRRQPKINLSLQPPDVLAAAQSQSDLQRSDWREHHAKVKL